MTDPRPLDRRTLLAGAGGAAIALPFLQAMTARRAHAAAPPRRLVVVFTPNGFEASGWPTSASLEGTSLAPLAPFWRDLVVLRGLDMASCNLPPFVDRSHYQQWAHCLTAVPCVSQGVAGGVSFDMEAARRIGGDTRFLYSLHGVYADGATSWLDRAVGAPPQNDPSKIFDRLFSSLGARPDDLARVRARRKSVLDYVADSIARTSCRLGAADRRKLEAHLFAVRDLERRLATGTLAGTCRAPARPGPPPPGPFTDPAVFPATSRAQIDLLVMALSCDLTRVGGLQYTRAVAGGRPVWLGLSEDHHELSHYKYPQSPEKLRRINAWYAGEVAYLLGKLKAAVQPDGGTLLDSTVVLWVSELGIVAGSHDRTNLGMVVAGRAGGRLRTGQLLSFNKLAHNNLFLEILNALLPAGQPPLASFGDRSLPMTGVPDLRS